MWWLASAACAAPLPEGVQTATGQLQREGQDPLPVRVTWPTGAGPYPILVFSHGLGGSRDAYMPLVGHWASKGYVVLQPTHPDSLQNRAVRDRLAGRTPDEILADPILRESWRARIQEVGLVLDRLDALVGAVEGLAGSQLDRERIGVGGHSFGAHTSMLAGGLTIGGMSFREGRADAVLLISPQGPGAGITSSSYESILAPSLVVTGSEDHSPIGGQGPEWRLEAWQGIAARPKWLMFIDGAHHGFGGISGRMFAGAGAADPKQVECVAEITTLFWDATVRGDPAARAALDSGTSAACTAARGTLTAEIAVADRPSAPRRRRR